MVAAPALPPQVFVPERARTRSEAVRHRTGRPSTLRLVTTAWLPPYWRNLKVTLTLQMGLFRLSRFRWAPRIRVAAGPRVTLDA